MSESTSDALFGVDGTQAPDPLPDPPTGLGRGTWRGAPELPPIHLPPIPDESTLRAAIFAALGGEDSAEPVDPDRAAAPEPPAEPAEPDGPPAPQPGDLPAPTVGPTSQGVGLQVPGQPHASTGVSSSPLVPPLFPSAPSRSRRPAGQRYRPPMAAAFRRPMPPADLRRRAGRERPGGSRQTPANLALGGGLFVALIIVVALVYNIITGFLESISRLVP